MARYVIVFVFFCWWSFTTCIDYDCWYGVVNFIRLHTHNYLHCRSLVGLPRLCGLLASGLSTRTHFGTEIALDPLPSSISRRTRGREELDKMRELNVSVCLEMIFMHVACMTLWYHDKVSKAYNGVYVWEGCCKICGHKHGVLWGCGGPSVTTLYQMTSPTKFFFTIFFRSW